MTAEEIVELIKLKYKTNDTTYNPSVVLEQVPDATGFNQGRWIDVAVFQMWSTKGLTRSAFEIKISRADFLNELRHPEKYQWCQECFHEFWFVAPKDVIQVEELPIGAGWMYPRGKQLCIARHAVRNKEPILNDHLLAAFMRAANKAILAATKTSVREILQESIEHQRALTYYKAVLAFLESRNVSHFNLLEPEYKQREKVGTGDIVELLNKATMDRQLLQDKDNLMQIADKFQVEIANLVGLFLTIANKSLLARDEMGRHIVSAYGGQDESSVETLRNLQKNNKLFGANKHHAELIEAILNLEG